VETTEAEAYSRRTAYRVFELKGRRVRVMDWLIVSVGRERSSGLGETKVRHANRVEEGRWRGDATLQLKWQIREVVPDARLTNE